MRELLRDRDTHVEEDVLAAVAANERSGRELLALLLRVRRDEVEKAISTRVLVRAVENRACGDGMIKLLLWECDIHEHLRYAVFAAAAEAPGNGLGLMRLLLRVYEDKHGLGEIAHHILASAAGDIEGGERIAEFVLRECGDRVRVPSRVLKVMFRYYDHEIVAILLEKQAYHLWTAEGAMEAALGDAALNIGSGAKIINLLLRQYGGDQVPIDNSDAVDNAARNEWCGREILELLFLQCDDQVYITETTVRNAAGNKRSGLEILELLICERGGEIEVTEYTWKAAAENPGCGLDVVKLLLGRCCDEVRVTPDRGSSSTEQKLRKGHYGAASPPYWEDIPRLVQGDMCYRASSRRGHSRSAVCTPPGSHP